eukprot:CAMPEP_0202698318 /NCGR_PEP_ID=MMETSP1385-20130828/11591_1 /ASSEMBLY_ACC=CAM_ASM_000861 /TAXON_ID=933848 /ORGANISM="Elphidium margaritaceum" /LENGTH=441 /DNA_ID=CAMNT_0049355001 /DNA_START=116 /DNA_END=1441 /DNA_ORIENTATION=-
MFINVKLTSLLYQDAQHTTAANAHLDCHPCFTHLNQSEYDKLFALPADDDDDDDSSTPAIDIIISWAGINKASASITQRNRDNNELLYCLRAIFSNMPWFNHIFIVVSSATYSDILEHNSTFLDPHQLTLYADRISIINQVELLCIFDQCAAGINNTNSMAFEAAMHRIPNLSEYYLYFNDDFFIGRPVHWSYFYRKIQLNNGNDSQSEYILYPRMPYIFYKTFTELGDYWTVVLKKYLFDDDAKSYQAGIRVLSDTYAAGIIPSGLNASDVPDSNRKGRILHMWMHTPWVLVKQYMIEFENEYPKWFRAIRSHKRRYYGLRENLNQHYLKRLLMDSEKYGMNLDVFDHEWYDHAFYGLLIKYIDPRLVSANHHHYWMHGTGVMNQMWSLRFNLKMIEWLQPVTFNINDDIDGDGEQQLKLIQQFYQRYFSVPSPVEKTAL